MTVPVPGVQGASPAEAFRRLDQLRMQRVRELGRPLTSDELKSLEAEQPCPDCGGHHARACPRVKSHSWHSNGHPASVEYWPPDLVDWGGVVFEDQGEDAPGGLVLDRNAQVDLALLLAVLDEPPVVDAIHNHLDASITCARAARRLRLLLDSGDEVQSGQE
jgi:hypothetical protein